MSVNAGEPKRPCARVQVRALPSARFRSSDPAELNAILWKARKHLRTGRDAGSTPAAFLKAKAGLQLSAMQSNKKQSRSNAGGGG